MPASTHSAATHGTLTATPHRAVPSDLPLRRAATTPLALWHLLSLDAPSVAALWVVFIARTAHVALPWSAPAAMFLAVWVLYAADRLLDARARTGVLEARHHFHAAHRQAFLVGMALATPALALLIRDIPPAAIHLYLLLGVLLFAWLLLIHLPPAAVRLPKELAVGIFFPAAVFIPTVARAQWLRPVLLPEAILFAAVCGLNCLYIFAWEHPAAGRLASANDAHWTTLWAGRHLHTLTFATVAASLVVAAFALQFAYPVNPLRLTALPAFACAGSVLLLHQLSRSRARLSPTHLRAAADLCLLTPLALLPVIR